ncbi:MAG: preprotein translocase subunit SecG [Candidatus Harrisonbacteria bacterium]|nr:preprotein translocase subunit SecG [Candidatus Harrisonbacteria bacterium]
MNFILTFAQIAVSVILIILVLLQERGSGLGGAFGGSEAPGFYQARRGLEKVVFTSTIILTVVFVALAFVNLVN